MSKINALSEEKDTPVIPIETKNFQTQIGYKRLIAIAASVLLLLSLGLFMYNKHSESSKPLSESVAKDTSAAQLLLMGYKLKHDIIIVHLHAVKAPIKDCVGCIIWDRTSKQVFFEVQNLPPLPEGQQYQLWAMNENVPTNAGIIEDITAVKKITTIGKIEKAQLFALTIEKKGGSSTPKGEMFATVTI